MRSCYQCRKQLISRGVNGYSIVIASAGIPQDNSPTMDIYMYPPVPNPLEFCKWSCVNEHVQGRLGLNKKALNAPQDSESTISGSESTNSED